MPRPNPPPLLLPPIPVMFVLGEHEKHDLARALGLKALTPLVAGAIAEAIAVYKATERGSPDTTVGNTLAELADLRKRGRVFNRAVTRLADDRSGVDCTTLGIMQPLAKAVLAGEPGSRERLMAAAVARATALRNHPRVQTAKEPLRFFCGMLREIFQVAAAPEFKPPLGDGWHYCRKFALEIFTAAGIEHADFIAHPERLTEYLGTDISTDP
jgi:hypothetical protein